jgi:hypothetical protein
MLIMRHVCGLNAIWVPFDLDQNAIAGWLGTGVCFGPAALAEEPVFS